MPTVSVVIPTFNRVDLLRQAVLALANQSRVPDEIIVVDDGSSDETAAFLASPPVPLVALRQTNQGPSAARNAGLSVARGEWIILHDDDDLLPVDSIRDRLQCANDEEDIDAWYGDCVDIDYDGNIAQGSASPAVQPAGDIFPSVAIDNYTPVHSVMFRRRCLEESGMFPVELNLSYCEDWDFWIRMSAVISFGRVQAVVAHYRRNHRPLSIGVLDAMASDAWKVQSRVFAMPRFRELTPDEQAQIYRRYAIRCLRIGKAKLAATAMQRAFKHSHATDDRLLCAACRTIAVIPEVILLRTVRFAVMVRNALLR